jgi:hypothetical protein
MKKKIDETVKPQKELSPVNREVLKLKFSKTDSRWDGETADGMIVTVVCESQSGPLCGLVKINGEDVFMVGTERPERVVELMNYYCQKYAIEEEL